MTEAGNTIITHYLTGGFQYSSGFLQFFPHAEGYVTNVLTSTDCPTCRFKPLYSLNYVFNYTDHLGNVRVSYAQENGALKILEENSYYPFGLKHTRNNVNSKMFVETNGTTSLQTIGELTPYTTYFKNNYKYNGKELQDELGLNMYDYGARLYDPAVARWFAYDPKAEVNQNWTPYRYAFNNPLRFIDPDGMLEGDYYTTEGEYLGWDGKNDGKTYAVKEGDYKNLGDGKNAIYAKTELAGVSNELLLAFASLIHAESSGSKDESYTIGNVTMNFIDGGGSTQLPTLDDVAMYDNRFAQGATQSNFSDFIALGEGGRNSKFAVGAAINAIGYSQGSEGFQDYSNKANGWDGIDLISSTWKNNHRDYSWSTGSKDLLSTYKKDNNGGVDVTKFTYKDTGYQISATKIIGKTIYTNITTGRGEKKQSNVRFDYKK